MSNELPPYPTRTNTKRPDSPVPVAAANRVNMRWITLRYTSTDPLERKRAEALREQSRNIRFHKGSVTL